MAVAQVAIEQLALGIAGLGLKLLDLWVNVAIADQDVGPAVVVYIEESAAPSQILRVRTQSGSESRVFEIRSAHIVIKRRSIAREICLHKVEVAVQVIVCRGDTHAGLRLAVRAKSASSLDRNIFELAVFLVLIERASGRVIRYINVRPAVVIEIGSEHTKAVGAVGAEDACGFRNVGESSVAVVVVKDIFPALQSRRPA